MFERRREKSGDGGVRIRRSGWSNSSGPRVMQKSKGTSCVPWGEGIKRESCVFFRNYRGGRERNQWYEIIGKQGH